MNALLDKFGTDTLAMELFYAPMEKYGIPTPNSANVKMARSGMATRARCLITVNTEEYGIANWVDANVLLISSGTIIIVFLVGNCFTTQLKNNVNVQSIKYGLAPLVFNVQVAEYGVLPTLFVNVLWI